MYGHAAPGPVEWFLHPRKCHKLPRRALRHLTTGCGVPGMAVYMYGHGTSELYCVKTLFMLFFISSLNLGALADNNKDYCEPSKKLYCPSRRGGGIGHVNSLS